MRESPVFRSYLTARLVSQTGTSMAPLALAFAVLQLGGGAGALGGVLAASLIPQTVLMLIGGAVADRNPRGRIMVVAHLVAGVNQAVVVALLLTGHGALWQLYVSAVVAGGVGAFFGPAAQGRIKQLVDKDAIREANALVRLCQNVVKVIAPAAAGVLIGFAGAEAAIGYNTLTFFVAAWMLSRLKVPLTPIKNSNMLRSLREGWTDFWSRRWLWIMVGQSAACCTPWLLGFMIYGPVYAKAHLGGAQAWGLVSAGFAGGLITGSVVVLLLRPQRVGFVACTAMGSTALPLAALALHAPVPVLVAATFVTGIGLDVSINTFGSFQQREVPIAMQARTSSYSLLAQTVPIPVGYLVAGPLERAIGLVPALAGCAIVIVVVAFLPLLSREVRAMRLPAPEPIAPVTGRDVVVAAATSRP